MKIDLGKVLLLALTICLITVKLNAQTTDGSTITAKITDAQNNETVPFATASVIDRKTKAVVKVAQSDVNGILKITGLKSGVFTFKISYVGYQTAVRDSVAITGAPKQISFGTIKIKPAKGTVLNEVKITTQKSTMQLGIDKKVFSVDQSLVSEGGSASDLLQNVPTVQVDMDGNVSLRGSTGVKVLVDGKPSLIAGGDVATILQSIPASSIESVEVINNPSAKYDAEGQSGIINIVLKKNKKLGFNGSVALTAGNRDNYNANTNLSFQNKRINLYGNYSYQYKTRLGGGYNNITYLDTISKTPASFANQNTKSKGVDKGHNVKAGIDYYVTDKSILSFSGNFNSRDNDKNDILTIDKLNAMRAPKELSNRTNISNGSGDSYDLNLDYSLKFKKPREELTFNLGYSKGTNDNVQVYTTSIYNKNGIPVNLPDSINNNNTTGSNKNYNVQMDYSLPVGKTGKFEAGYRSQIRYADNFIQSYILNQTTGNYDKDFSLTNDFHSKDQVHAVYANFQNQVGNFGYQVGLRGEDATLNTVSGAFQSNGNTIYTPARIAYTRLYPSVYLTEKFKGEQQLQLSYSRRVNRPRGWDTNPFLDVSDPLNYRQGNPNLKPEDVHAYELSYNKFWPKVTFISTVYVRQTNDVIERIRSLPDINGITITTPQNLAKQVSTGLELIGKVDVIKAWNFTANANLYRSKINGAPQYGTTDNSGFSWDANLTSNVILPGNVTLQIKGDYNSSQVIAQGTRNAMYGLDAGAKYDFKNRKSSLSLNVRNILDSRGWSVTSNNQVTLLDFKRYMTGPMASLTFSYRFGKTDFGFKKSKKTEQTEQQRPDEGSF